MNVEELKKQARSFEQQGETAAALELYRNILSELEGTPAIWRELPLYVKAGDLYLKLEDSSNAIANYEKAANAYAAYGSSKSVIALCAKILRVNGGRTHVFLRLVRLMIERKHLADARLVLLEYAERLKLPKAAVVLKGLADAADEEMKPHLEMVLEMGGRYEYARAQGRDHVTETESGDTTAEETTQRAVDDEATNIESDNEATISLAAAEQMDHAVEDSDESDEVRADADEPEAAVEAESQLHDEPTDDVELSTAPESMQDDEVRWVEDSPSIPMATPRASRQVLFREAEKRKHPPMPLLIGVGAIAGLIVIGLSLLLFGVIPIGGESSQSAGSLAPTPTTSQPDSALSEAADSTDAPAIERDSPTAEDAVTSAASLTDGTADSAMLQTPSAAEESAVGEPADPAPQEEAVVDSSVDLQPEESGDTSAERASPEPPPTRGVMVQDFDVESSTEFEADGRIGYRVTQILGTGAQLVLSAVYYGDDISSAPGTEEMTLMPLAGDTTTAIIRFDGYSVEARALVSASVLEALLSRLVEVPISN